jgi:hypothetical protein
MDKYKNKYDIYFKNKMEYCVFYDKNSMEIQEFFPNDLDIEIKTKIINSWSQQILREILIYISENESITAPEIKEKIGHSMSTLHDSIKKLELLNLIESEMTYVDNKKKIIKPKILFVTKNPKYKTSLKKFFQGLWVDSTNSKRIIDLLKSEQSKYFSPIEIANKTKIPIDDVELVLNSWESITTRGISDFLKEIPFEKKVVYKYKKH